MSDINTSLERIEDPVPVVVIKTEIDNNGEINNDSKTKSKSDCELPSKTQHCSFLCSICQKNYTDQKFFYEHLESHYVPASPDYFECFVCQGTYASQVDFYTHSREHYKPSLVSELPNSVTVLLKSVQEIEEREKFDIKDIFNDGNIDNGDSNGSSETSENDNSERDDSDNDYSENEDSNNNDSSTDDSDTEDSDTDFELEEGRHFKQEMKWDEYEATDDDISNEEFICPLCSVTERHPNYDHFLKSHVCKPGGQSKDNKAPNQNKRHVCNVCQKWFPTITRLARHQAMHTSVRPFVCIKCQKRFKTTDSLNKHLKRYKDGECSNILADRPYACDSCGARFQLNKSLQRHNCRGLDHDPKMSVVRKKYGNDEDEDDAPTDQKVHACDKCGATYTTGGSLRRHFLRHHSGVDHKLKKKEEVEEQEEDIIGEYSCEHCQLKFTLKRFLKTHFCHELRKVSEKICRCDVCGKSFSAHSQLNRHRLGHLKERPFKCTQCPKSFLTEREYKIHVTIHTGEEIQCEFCELVCRGAPSYKMHVKRKHRYNLKCELCNRKFDNRPSLKTHMRVHSNEKPFVCSQCGHAFHSFSGLHNHTKNIHTDFRKVRERTFICDLCGKGFFTKNRLKVHTESHNEVRNHLCTECGSGFKCKADLKKHMQRHSPPEIPCPYCNLLFTCKPNLRNHIDRRHKHGVKGQNRLEASI